VFVSILETSPRKEKKKKRSFSFISINRMLKYSIISVFVVVVVLLNVYVNCDGNNSATSSKFVTAKVFSKWSDTPLILETR
jgi:hypothetical protein